MDYNYLNRRGRGAAEGAEHCKRLQLLTATHGKKLTAKAFNTEITEDTENGNINTKDTAQQSNNGQRFQSPPA